MTDIIERAEATLNETTDGPWSIVYESCDCGGGMPCGHGSYPYAIHGPVNEPTLNGNLSERYKQDYGHQIAEICELSDADAEFIAQARELIPQLIAELKSARAENEQLHELCKSADSIMASMEILAAAVQAQEEEQ